ncbi:MRN complex-interacting protein [Echinops telfairi]|uniref:MRN complex-interacting protein n=1 Tax=Echinops telfairi TaxID=9371 RepID=A0AC55CKZ2_ECHTE|nr:MRN complex-interacting protein [Echinops telfairi]
MKKSLKWTCKACGEKQSFLRAYGEGSGADCRRHVQKLNLLQGQVSEMSLRSPQEPANTIEGESADHEPDANRSLQEGPPATESRWLKYLEKGSADPGLEGGGVHFNSQPSSRSEKPDPRSSSNHPRKRRWSLCPARPPPSPGAQAAVSREVDSTAAAQLQGYDDVTAKAKQASRGYPQENSEDWNTSELTVPQWKPPRHAQQAKAASSKWDRFLLSPETSSQMDAELPRPLQTGPSAASTQPEPWTQSLKAGHPNRVLSALQPPWVPHTPTSGAWGPFRQAAKQPEGGHQAKEAPQPTPVQLRDLFQTGEDFDEDL